MCIPSTSFPRGPTASVYGIRVTRLDCRAEAAHGDTRSHIPVKVPTRKRHVTDMKGMSLSMASAVLQHPDKRHDRTAHRQPHVVDDLNHQLKFVVVGGACAFVVGLGGWGRHDSVLVAMLSIEILGGGAQDEKYSAKSPVIWLFFGHLRGSNFNIQIKCQPIGSSKKLRCDTKLCRLRNVRVNRGQQLSLFPPPAGSCVFQLLDIVFWLLNPSLRRPLQDVVRG